MTTCNSKSKCKFSVPPDDNTRKIKCPADSEKRAGWWDAIIGPGKAIDTNKFYVVCPNNIGGCHGSTGPTSINQETG